MKTANIIIASALVAASTAASAQCALSQFADAPWSLSPITTSLKNPKPTVSELLRAFNSSWKLDIIADGLKNNKLTVDHSRESFLHTYGAGDVPATMQAKLWRARNGHTIMAINQITHAGADIYTLAFLDYNPQDGTINPVRSPIRSFKPAFESMKVSVDLPVKEGDDIILEEIACNSTVGFAHSYSFDGKKLDYASTDLVIDQQLLKQAPDYKENYSQDNAPARYALLDIDHDNVPELWLSSKSGDNQELFSLNTPSLISYTYYKTHFNFHPSAVSYAGGCGTMCYITEYTPLVNSIPRENLQVITSGDMEGNETREYFHGFSSQGEAAMKELPKAQGEKMEEAINNSDRAPVNPENVKWNQIRKVQIRTDMSID
ncbi:MAG: hypothetical protein IJ523_09515 [Succinivibrionaceae bacterium]|nr:hypothetical protein [Succinivibrionaceae bacterium]